MGLRAPELSSTPRHFVGCKFSFSDCRPPPPSQPLGTRSSSAWSAVGMSSLHYLPIAGGQFMGARAYSTRRWAMHAACCGGQTSSQTDFNWWLRLSPPARLYRRGLGRAHSNLSVNRDTTGRCCYGHSNVAEALCSDVKHHRGNTTPGKER